MCNTEWVRYLARRLAPPPARRVLKRLIGITLLAGSSVACPCCGSSYRRFLPYGDNVHSRLTNVNCPNCGSLSRQRATCLELHGQRLPTNVLIISPDPALEGWFRAKPAVRAWTMDPYQRADVQADILALPFNDCSFGLIICSHVLEHVRNDRLALRELHRVLSPGGRALISVPLDLTIAHTIEAPEGLPADEHRRLFGQLDHVRTYGSDITDRIADPGWDVSVIRIQERYSSSDMFRYRLTPDERIFVAARNATNRS